MSDLPPTDMESWGQGGTAGGPHASFSRRYVGPLARLARRTHPWIDTALAEDLAQGYCVRELERDLGGRPPVFEVYDPARGERFRGLLTTCFLRYCRDELEKEQRRRGVPIEEVASSLASEEGFERLVALDFVSTVRAEVLAALPPDARPYAELKWPIDGSDPPSDRALAKRLGVSRDQVAVWHAATVQVLAREVRSRLEVELGPRDAPGSARPARGLDELTTTIVLEAFT